MPYLSIDHLKMGLIRSGQTTLTPEHDDELVGYLWPIVREMVKTAIENHQHLIVEGCYIPFDWRGDFEEPYLSQIRHCCLVMSQRYIQTHFDDILAHASDVEKRLDDACCTARRLMEDNARNLRLCQQYGCEYIWIDSDYRVDLKLEQMEE